MHDDGNIGVALRQNNRSVESQGECAARAQRDENIGRLRCDIAEGGLRNYVLVGASGRFRALYELDDLVRPVQLTNRRQRLLLNHLTAERHTDDGRRSRCECKLTGIRAIKVADQRTAEGSTLHGQAKTGEGGTSSGPLGSN